MLLKMIVVVQYVSIFLSDVSMWQTKKLKYIPYLMEVCVFNING